MQAAPDQAIHIALEELLRIGVRHGDHLRKVNKGDLIIVIHLRNRSNGVCDAVNI